MTDRLQIHPMAVGQAHSQVSDALERALRDKGHGAFTSTHEAYGVMAEEVAELLDAIRSNDVDRIIAEFTDVAVSATFAVACLITTRETGDR